MAAIMLDYQSRVGRKASQTCFMAMGATRRSGLIDDMFFDEDEAVVVGMAESDGGGVEGAVEAEAAAVRGGSGGDGGGGSEVRNNWTIVYRARWS